MTVGYNKLLIIKIYIISIGTVNNDVMSFYKTCISAFKNTDYQVIMSVGKLVPFDDFDDLPDNISVFSRVDKISVLKETDAFVSHCGMNSVSESLYFEVPLVLFPQATEQKGVAERVLQFGARIKPDKADAVSVLGAVNETLNDSSYKKNAIKISGGFKKSSGAKGAADKIIQVCNDAM